jgi:hypothetical protein
MIKISQEALDSMESSYPGIKQNVAYFEAMDIPPCPKCGSSDTASVQVGIIGRTIYLCAATTKFTLVPNSPKPGDYLCQTCRHYFNDK